MALLAGTGGEGFTESWWQHSKENVFNWLGGKPIARRSVGQLGRLTLVVADRLSGECDSTVYTELIFNLVV